MNLRDVLTIFVGTASLVAGAAFVAGVEVKPQTGRTIASEGGECSFYDELSATLGCDGEGYLRAFGAHYCRAYERSESALTPKGQAFLQANRACLIKALRSAQLNCENVEDVAIATHLPCYLENDVCSLTLSDRLRIVWIARRQLWRPKYRELLDQVQTACIRRNSQLNAN